MARGRPVSVEAKQAIIGEYISGVPLKEIASRHSLSPETITRWIKEGNRDFKKTQTEPGRVSFNVHAAEKKLTCDGNCEQARRANEKLRKLQAHILDLVSACIDA